MKRPQQIAQEQSAMGGIVELTNIFEGIASIKINQTKDRVLKSHEFFSKLWHIYSQIKADELFNYGRDLNVKEVSDKDLFIIITGEGGFSGDIDQKLIQLMLKQYKPGKQDIIVVGHHGAIQLAQQGIGFEKYFKLPDKDENISTWPIIKEVLKYKTTTAYYQTYVSLMVQEVKSITLSSAIAEQGKRAAPSEEVISERNYIFEPNTQTLMSHLERSMLQITITQIILESKLAQYASRFRAMTAAHNKAEESFADIKLQYNRVKRAVKDERLKEIINGIHKTEATA